MAFAPKPRHSFCGAPPPGSCREMGGVRVAGGAFPPLFLVGAVGCDLGASLTRFTQHRCGVATSTWRCKPKCWGVQGLEMGSC